MFNSSAKLSLLLTLKECRSCVVFLMQDHSNRRVYACVTSPNLNRSRQTNTAACRERSAGKEIALGYRVGQGGTPNTTEVPRFPILLTAREDRQRTDSLLWRGKNSEPRLFALCTPVSAGVRPKAADETYGSTQSGESGSLLNRR